MAKSKKKVAKLKAKEYSKKECMKINREDGLTMFNLKKYTFRDFIDACTARYSSRLCYTIVGGEDEVSFTYRYLAFKVHSISQYLLNIGIKKGDKIAIYGEGSPMWMMMYFGITSIGAIAVPILPGFTPRETIFALNNCGAKLVCGGKKQILGIKDYILENNLEVIRLEDIFYLPADSVKIMEDKNYFDLPGLDVTRVKFNIKELSKLPLEEDDIASIIYTSGTTGASKGVVLSHKNLLRNADLSTTQYIKLKPGMRALSILPVSHVYEFTNGQILCMMSGLEIHFLGKPPVVSILLPALKNVRPDVILSVPLLIEKVYKSAVAPMIKNGGKFEKVYNNKLTKNFVCRVVKKKLVQTFGGKLKFFGIGGAPLDREVEEFLYRGSFPYALGYGLTETSPLLAACGPQKKDHRIGYTGYIVPDVEMKLINKNEEGVGEIVVKGPNVMRGYYNNPELNKESFTEDGFFKTGDLGFINNKNQLAIKGRCKTMILGPAGENIYPESIESVINNQQFVEESLVVSDNGSLLALIKIDIELMAKSLAISIDEAKEEAKKYIHSLKQTVNKELSSQNRIDSVELQEESFERTATQKIKRFLYPKNKK